LALGWIGYPIKSVLFALGAENAAGKGGPVLAVARLPSGRAPGRRISAHHLDRIEFVRANAAVDDLVGALVGVEPPAAAVLHERDRHGPAVGPHHERDAAVG